MCRRAELGLRRHERPTEASPSSELGLGRQSPGLGLRLLLSLGQSWCHVWLSDPEACRCSEGTMGESRVLVLPQSIVSHQKVYFLIPAKGRCLLHVCLKIPTLKLPFATGTSCAWELPSATGSCAVLGTSPLLLFFPLKLFLVTSWLLVAQSVAFKTLELCLVKPRSHDVTKCGCQHGGWFVVCL